MKVDNDDGTVNWENRATALVLVEMMCGKSPVDILKEADKNSPMYPHIKKYIERIKERIKELRQH